MEYSKKFVYSWQLLILNVMINKIVISSSNTKTVAFLEELSRKKAAIKKKLEMRLLEKVSGNVNTRTGK